jgi:hypothetical protein
MKPGKLPRIENGVHALGLAKVLEKAQLMKSEIFAIGR